MIRVIPMRCGYGNTEATKYACVGAPSLKDAMKPLKLVCDTQLARTSGFEVYTGDILEYSWIDNYYNLPEKIKGFVMVIDVLKEFSGVTAPEKSCNTNMDPYSNPAGFLNLYAQKGGICVWKYDKESSYSGLTNSLLCAKADADDTEHTLYPAILEPILDTDFPPVTIDVPTNVDAQLDSIMIIIAFLINWRILVEKKINDIYNKLKAIGSIRNLLVSMAMNSTTQCDCFSITWSSGRVSGKGNPSSPKYDISGCAIDINGESVWVEGKENATAPFFAYADIELDGDEDGLYVSSAKVKTTSGGAPSGGHMRIIIGIGEVRLVEGSDAKTKSGKVSSHDGSYWMYVVEQDNCHPNTEAVRTDSEGFLYIQSGGEIPFTAYDYEECPEMEDPDEHDDGL